MYVCVFKGKCGSLCLCIDEWVYCLPVLWEYACEHSGYFGVNMLVFLAVSLGTCVSGSVGIYLLIMCCRVPESMHACLCMFVQKLSFTHSSIHS